MSAIDALSPQPLVLDDLLTAQRWDSIADHDLTISNDDVRSEAGSVALRGAPAVGHVPMPTDDDRCVGDDVVVETQ
jgi:hypothetical protein